MSNTPQPPVEAPKLAFNLMPLQTLRRHYHRLGNRLAREVALTENPVKKQHLIDQRDLFLSIANYLDIADHIKMSEL